ncbi:hypothetical protein F4Y93_12400 [Candidatus Poribacteria bacterium]|nr:hypothetical protein [Candidatus Poribacteria bacterium]
MSHYETFLLFLALAFCGYASYTDLKTQQIYNFCSVGLLYGGTLSQLMAWYLGATTPLYILGLFFGSGLISFALYWFGIFSPGDSKLFWGVCLIFPLSLFRSLNGILSFPPLILVLNIIIPYSVAVLAYLLFRFAFGPNKLSLFHGFLRSILRQSMLLEKLFNLLLLLGISSALTYLLEWLGWQPDRFVRLVIVLAMFALLRKSLSRVPKTPVYYAIVGFVCIWLSVCLAASMAAFFLSAIFLFGMYFAVFVIAKQWVLSLASLMLDRVIDVSDLEVGMIPAEQIVRVAQPDGTVGYEKRQVVFSSGHDTNTIITPDPRGLNADERAELQHLAAEGALADFENRIRVQPSIRFAPVITVGVLLTILCRGPFYLIVLQLL